MSSLATYTPALKDKEWTYASREIEEAFDRIRVAIEVLNKRAGDPATLMIMDETVDLGEAMAIDFAGDAVSADFDTVSKIGRISITALTHPQVMSRISLRF